MGNWDEKTLLIGIISPYLLVVGAHLVPETNIFAPENGWLEDEFPFGAKGIFSGASR